MTYCITYESNLKGYESQMLCTNLDFETATNLATAMQAEDDLQYGTSNDGVYVVQPQLTTAQKQG